MKRFYLPLFTLFICFISINVYAQNIEIPNGDGVSIFYKMINGGAELAVVSNPQKYSGNIVIPETVVYNGKTYKVTSIDNHAFGSCDALTSITIPNSVTSIGDWAFSRCVNLSFLTSLITDPGSISVNAFGKDEFASLTLYVPEGSVEKYRAAEGWNQFQRYAEGIAPSFSFTDFEVNNIRYVLTSANTVMVAYKLRRPYEGNITIPASVIYEGNTFSVTAIAVSAFKSMYSHYSYSGNSNLKSVVIPKSVTYISDNAFTGCSGLTSIKIESGNPKYDSRDNCNAIIESASNTLFIGCKGTVIPNSVTSIGKSAFESSSELISITIPNSVKYIGESAFYRCWKLASIVIPNGVISIGKDAFSNCNVLASITIGNSVTSISKSAFVDCNALTSIKVESSNPKFDSRDGCNAIIETSSNTLFMGFGCTTIPNSVTVIGDSAFAYCRSLTSVTIPNSVTTIKEHAFSCCFELTSVTIPNSVTFIGDNAFHYCDIQSIIIPNSITSIGSDVFSSCDRLSSVSIPNSVTSIGDNAFSGCRSLTSITIPEGVTSIGESAFAYCENLTSVTIPSSVSSIGEKVFDDCGLMFLTSLITDPTSIPDNVFDSEAYATMTLYVPEGCIDKYKGTEGWDNFQNYLEGTAPAFVEFEVNNIRYILNSPNSVKVTYNIGQPYEGNVTIPASVTYGGYTFSVTEIGRWAFNNMVGASSFTDNSNLISVIIPNSVTSISRSAFEWCSGLGSIKIENGNPKYDSRDDCNAIIETSTNTLLIGCKGSFIPNSVTSIGESAFEDVSELRSVIIPGSVTSIGNYAFRGCSLLSYVIVDKAQPISIDASVFSNRANATLIVPDGSKASYEAADYWKEFKDIKETVVSIEYDDICYNILSYIDKTVEVTSREGKYSGNLKIPSFVEIDNVKYSVIRIGKAAFNNCSDLTSITIPNGVTVIGDSAFAYCRSLTSITIPNSVTTIKNHAFRSCSRLISVTIPNSVTVIGDNAFSYCNSLSSISIPQGVTSIGESAFAHCVDLPSITIPNSVSSIGDNAFVGCRLMFVTSLNTNPVSIPNDVFDSDAYATMTLYVPEGCIDKYKGTEGWDKFLNYSEETVPPFVEFEVNNIRYLLNSFNSVKVTYNMGKPYEGNFVIPASVTYEGYTFTVTEIGDKAFLKKYGALNYTDNTNLISVFIPKSVTSINRSAFLSCSGLESIQIENGNLKYDSRENCNAIIETSSNTLLIGCKGSVIPNSVTSIGEYAFAGVGELRSITIPSSVTSIGNYAFSGCSRLSYVIVDKAQPISIDASVFSNRANATLIVPDGSKASYEAADYWKEFKEIIEAGVISEDDDFFYNILSYTDKTVEIVAGEILYSGNLKIPSFVMIDNELFSVIRIGDYAFYGCNELTSIIIPNSVTSIGNYAFQYCNNLASITIPPCVTSIGDEVFSCCENLTSVTIPNSVTSIGDWVFDYCSGLTSVSIGSGLSSIGIGIFNNCSSLTSITVDSNNLNYDSRDNCNAIIKTNSNTLFRGCKGTIIPNSVTSIDRYGFEYCYGLTSINIPNNITSIGNSAFNGCKDLTTVIIGSLNPLTIGKNTFSNRSNATLFVPEGCAETYKAANYWKEFKDIREFSENGFIISANDIFRGTNLWAGYVSQEDLALPDELEAYIITDLGTTTATAYPIDYIPESEPVLLKREDTTIGSFEMLPGTGTAPTMNLLKTYSTDKIVSNREGFVLYNDEFVLVNEGTLPAGCVFLPANSTVVALTRSIIINGDDATEIENTKVDNDVPKDQWYDFQGRKLERKPVKSGIYILNGRKVVVKY